MLSTEASSAKNGGVTAEHIATMIPLVCSGILKNDLMSTLAVSALGLATEMQGDMT